jgi:peptide/nickel transport system permease protein
VSQSAAEAQAGFQFDAGGGEEAVAKSPRQLFWARFKQDKLAFAGAVVIVLMVAGALSAPFWAHALHHGVNQQFRQRTNLYGVPLGPGHGFYFGSDELGRDLFVRVLYGAQVSLKVAFLATGVEVILGVIAGLFSGYMGGKTDTIISRFMDLVLSVPFLLLGIALAVSLSPTPKASQVLVISIIAFFGWPYIARIVRGQVLSLRESQFVEAARSLGASTTWIMFREILPNLIAIVLTYATLIIPVNIIGEATLSFLGVGIKEPTPSWGNMLNTATNFVSQGAAWWYMLFPGLALFITVLAFNLLGDGLRDALDPRTGR